MDDANSRCILKVLKKKLETLREYEELYKHLPPLPPPLPYPAYWPRGQEKPSLSTYQTSLDFYEACAQGDLSKCHDFVQREQPSSSDLLFALEQASHNFQIEIARYLLKETGAELHFRCFRRNQNHPNDLVSQYNAGSNPTTEETEDHILATERPELCDLLVVFLEDGGWHPNRLLGPLQKGKLPAMFDTLQEVALHYPRCLKDMSILRMLLDAGADPTIARERGLQTTVPLAEVPIIRLKGHIVQTAVNVSMPESVDLLLAHGASFDSTTLLHSLARCTNKSRQKRHPSLTPEAFYPLDAGPRLTMAQYLLNLGEDINAWKNIYSIVSQHEVYGFCEWQATPLYHAVLYQDWEYVQWLLEHGADPNGFPEHRDSHAEMCVCPLSPTAADAKFQEILNRFRASKEARAMDEFTDAVDTL